MSFCSVHFLFFFPIVVVLYFIIPQRYKWTLLLAASYYFYMAWKAEYVVLLAVSTLTAYAGALRLGKTRDSGRKKAIFLLTLLVNLGILFVFKYFNFFSGTLGDILDLFNLSNRLPELKLLLPIGISFYTFQVLSYLIDVYRGIKTPEKHLGIFAAYVSFFPQLVAGPIERSTRFLPQFFEKHRVEFHQVAYGLQLMLWGFFKKIVIADNLAHVVNAVYGNPGNYEGIHFIIATAAFSFQIFCDFSGYSDIALGAARVMGFRLMINFNRPYHAQSISEFWNRWHISLSTWLRDYLFLPIAYAVARKTGDRKPGNIKPETWGYMVGMLVTMFLGGLWHGANWTFVCWGMLHGFFLVFSRLTKKTRKRLVKRLRLNRAPKLHKAIRIMTTFSLVSFAWIFFRAQRISDAFYIIGNLFSGVGEFLVDSVHFLANLGNKALGAFLINNELGISHINLLVILPAILIMELGHLLQRRSDCITAVVKDKAAWIKWTVYYVLVFWIFIFGRFEDQAFIYFQF